LFDEVDEFYYKLMLEEGQQIKGLFKIYPDSADDIVFIELINTDITCAHLLNIYDITGKKCKTEQLRNDYKVSWFNIQDLQPRIYFLEVICNNMLIDVQKLIIE